MLPSTQGVEDAEGVADTRKGGGREVRQGHSQIMATSQLLPVSGGGTSMTCFGAWWTVAALQEQTACSNSCH